MESESRRGKQGRAVETMMEGMGKNKRERGARGSQAGEPEVGWRRLSGEREKTAAIGSPWGWQWHLLVSPGQEESQSGTPPTACDQPRRCFVGAAVQSPG